jgi:hypothetical protein
MKEGLEMEPKKVCAGCNQPWPAKCGCAKNAQGAVDAIVLGRIHKAFKKIGSKLRDLDTSEAVKAYVDRLVEENHRWNDEFCSCGSDCATCQGCGDRVCGSLLQWYDRLPWRQRTRSTSGQASGGNVCASCASRVNLTNPR